MKLSFTFFFLIISLFGLGCASNGGTNTADNEEASAAGGSVGTTEEGTAYEGATGSELLMERYKSGQIEGYRE